MDFNRIGVMKTRVCTKCGGEKPETTEYFYRNKSCRGGLYTICKECICRAVRIRDAENPEEVRERKRRWQSENPEKVREANKRWAAENQEKVRESKKRWQAENPEKAREAKIRWQAENPEKQREAVRRWQTENPEKAREISRRCRNTLTPGYLKHLITKKYDIDHSEIGDELINAKRREIKYYRQFKQLNQLKK